MSLCRPGDHYAKQKKQILRTDIAYFSYIKSRLFFFKGRNIEEGRFRKRKETSMM